MSKFYTPKELADLLKINYHKVLELIHLGRLEAYKIDGACHISDFQLHKYLEANKYKSYWKGKI